MGREGWQDGVDAVLMNEALHNSLIKSKKDKLWYHMAIMQKVWCYFFFSCPVLYVRLPASPFTLSIFLLNLLLGQKVRGPLSQKGFVLAVSWSLSSPGGGQFTLNPGLRVDGFSLVTHCHTLEYSENTDVVKDGEPRTFEERSLQIRERLLINTSSPSTHRMFLFRLLGNVVTSISSCLFKDSTIVISTDKKTQAYVDNR